MTESRVSKLENEHEENREREPLMFDVRKRLYSLVPAILAALLQHTIQESTHYVAARLLVIAWAPAIVTTLIGCALYLAHDRWLASVPLLNAGLWFSMAYFLVVDPLYFAVLSSFFGGGDVAAVAAVGWPRWPVHALAGIVLLFNLRLVYKLRQEGKAEPERYLWPIEP
jgi:hypothetical protein